MKQTPEARTTAGLAVKHLGGIESAEIEFEPGVTILKGRNATNRSSLLRALSAVLGGREADVKGDADEGWTKLEVGEETFTRAYHRRNGTVAVSGEQYAGSTDVAPLFAYLLESNDARQAAANNADADLREIILRPVDMEEIEREIRETTREIERIKARIEELEGKRERLTGLKQRRRELESESADLESELEQKRDELDEASLDEGEASGDSEEDRILADLRETRSELESVKTRIETERESIAALQEEREEVAETLEEEPASISDISELGERLGTYQERKNRLDTLIERLQTITEFNEEMLEGDGEITEAFVNDDDDDAHVTEQLLAEGAAITCWTCGSEVDRSDVEAVIEELNELREEKVQERMEVAEEVSSLKEERSEIERKQKEREQAQHKRQRVEQELDRRRSTLTNLTENRDDLREEVEQLEERLREVQQEGREGVLAQHREVNELEFELESLRSDRDEVGAEIESIESAVDALPDLRAELEERRKERAALRDRIGDIERSAVESFNEHMEQVIRVLGYENIERIWLERRPGTESDETSFELHIVRQTDSGAVYEDTIDHLSESEREVVGLVFALAGYLVHDVHEEVPFMLLDSLEAIDAERIAALVDYFESFVPYLVIALLPEDARALDDGYRRVTSF